MQKHATIVNHAKKTDQAFEMFNKEHSSQKFGKDHDTSTKNKSDMVSLSALHQCPWYS